MTVPAARHAVLARVAGRIPAPEGDDGARVAVDGPDGSGKTVVAAELAAVVRELGRPVVRIPLDDVHHVRAVWYRQGRDSAQGFWQESFDYPRFRAGVRGRPRRMEAPGPVALWTVTDPTRR